MHAIGKIFTDHLKNLQGSTSYNRFLLDWSNLFIYKESVDLAPLEQPFSVEEIKQAVFYLNADGPDRFLIFFS